MAVLYVVEAFAVVLATTGLFDTAMSVHEFIGHMSSQFEFIRAHMQLSYYSPIVSGVYWSLTVIFLPVKSALFFLAPYNKFLIGKHRRYEFSHYSGGSFFNLAEYVAMKGLRRWTRPWMIVVALSITISFIYLFTITLAPVSVGELAQTQPINWPHAKVIVYEYFFKLSPITLIAAGSVFSFFQSAMPVAAAATISALIQLLFLQKGSQS